MRVIGYTYPWDLTEDPWRRERVLGLGLDAVAVAGAYHAVRAATSTHPHQRTKVADHAAFYRPVDPARFGTLVPRPAGWTASADAFGETVALLHGAGVPALAWTVLSHSSEVGGRHPDHTVVNAFGERYPWALCTSHPDVVELATALVSELAAGTGLDGVVLEALGHLGFEHGGLHDKTMSYSALERTLLSICFAPSCRAARGAEADDDLAGAVRGALQPGSPAGRPEASLVDVLGAERVALLAAGREQAVEQLAAAVAGVLPAEVHLHASHDVHATGPFVPVRPTLRGLPAGSAPVASAWGSAERIGSQVRALVEASDGAPVGAYLTFIEPGAPPLAEQVASAEEAGATSVHLYHLGLCSAAQLDEVAALVRSLR